jgi:hypothetical protein
LFCSRVLEICGKKNDAVLDRLQILNVFDYTEMDEIITALKKWTKANPQIKLIIIDTLIAQFRMIPEAMLASKIIHSVGALFNKIAAKRGICIITTDSLTYPERKCSLGSPARSFPICI